MLLTKLLQCARQHLVAQCQHTHNVQFTLAVAQLEGIGQALHFIELSKQLGNVWIQGLGLCGGGQPALDALKQREPQLHFRVRQNTADRRLGDVDQTCSRTHAAGEHDGVKNLNVTKTHACSLKQSHEITL